MQLRIPLLILFYFIAINLSLGQKVAVVLSGGGAKGIAHVGVIKALEEHNIPIDYVVGTSMGAIVAGCYAAGYSAKQIEAIMLSPQFQRWVNGDFEAGYNYFLYKDKSNSSFVTIKLSLDSTFNASFNSSIANDITLNFALPEYLSKASSIAGNNFDSLFIPARIIAADVFTQTEVILKKTSLPLALRTSLSVPFFYKPIKIDDKYLFDGGIYNNFPVDVAIDEFAPEVIIGANVSSKIFNNYPYGEDDKLINNSLVYMMLDKSDPERIPESGIYIEPDLTNYTAFDFDKAKMLIDSGYNATVRQIEEIKSKIDRRVNAEQLASSRKAFISKANPMEFNDIIFHGYNSRQRKYIRRVFKQKKDNTLTLEDIKKGYFKLVSENYFSSVYPDISFNRQTGKYNLELFGRPRSNVNVDVGGAIATRNISQIYLGTEYYYFNNFLLKNSLNFYAGSFYKSAQLRSRLYLAQFGLFYIEPELTYNKWDYLSSDDIFLDDNVPTVLERVDRRYAVKIGFPIGHKLKGVVHGSFINNKDEYGNTTNINSADTLDFLKLTGLRTGLRINRNNFNRKQYPNAGKGLSISFNYYDLKEEYIPGTTSNIGEQNHYHQWWKVAGRWEQYFHKGKWSTGYLLEGTYSSQGTFSNYYGTLINLPEFNPLQDSRTLLLQNFRAYSFGAFGIKNVLSLRSNLDMRLEGYIFKPFEEISFTEDIIGRKTSEELYLSATAALVLHSPVGPINLSVNYYDDAETQWGVLLHVGFLLFNEPSLGQ